MIRIKKLSRCELHTFMLVFLTSSFTIVNDVFSSIVTIGLWLILAFSLLISIPEKRINISENPIGVMVLLTIVFLASGLINNQTTLTILKNLFSLLTLWLFVINYDLKDALSAFLKIVYLIAAISIPMYFVAMFQPAFFNQFLANGTNGRVYYNFVVFNHIVGVNRNCGMFWEPGAYSSFLCLAILIWIAHYDADYKNDYKKIIILLIALFSTFSTTGYLCFALIILIYLSVKKRNKMEKILVITLIIGVIIFVLPSYYPRFIGSDSEVFGKIYNFNQYRNDYLNGTFNSSVSIRLFSITMPFDIFLKNPILGVGHDNLVEMTSRFTRGSITCTFINWFAIYGILYGIIMILGYMKLAKQIQSNKVVKALLFITLLMIICTEDFSQNAVYTGLAVYGYKAVVDNQTEGKAIPNEPIVAG